MQIEIINQLYRENLRGFKTNTLKRNWDALIVVLDGVYSISVNGQKSPMNIGKNEVAFIPSGVEISRNIIEPVTYYHFCFTTQIDHPFRAALAPCKLGIPEAQVLPIINFIEHAFPIPDNQELIVHIVERILADNYLFGKSKKIRLPHLSNAVKSTVKYMNAHLSDNLSIDMLAERVFLSHTGLIWKFKQELNTTPSQYLILLRLRYAKHLLLDGEYSITEVAEQCGYANPYYFTNAFRKYYGMSPTAFRKKYAEKSEQKQN